MYFIIFYQPVRVLQAIESLISDSTCIFSIPVSANQLNVKLIGAVYEKLLFVLSDIVFDNFKFSVVLFSEKLSLLH